MNQECSECFEAATHELRGEPLCDLHWKVHRDLNQKYSEAERDPDLADRVNRVWDAFDAA
jgi:broad specificity phosphatase PhoE